MKVLLGLLVGKRVKMMGHLLSGMNVTGQAIPLIKNGCANTVFNMDTIVKTL